MPRFHADKYCQDVLERVGLPEDIFIRLKEHSCLQFPGMVFEASLNSADRDKYPVLNELFPRPTFIIADKYSCRMVIKGPRMSARWTTPEIVTISSCTGSYVGWSVFDGWLAISDESCVNVVRLDSLEGYRDKSVLGLFAAMWKDVEQPPLLDIASRGQFQMERTPRGLKFVRVIGGMQMNLSKLLDIADIPKRYLPEVYMEMDWKRFAAMTYYDVLKLHSRVIMAAEDSQGLLIGECVLKTPGAELVDCRAKILIQNPVASSEHIREKILERYSGHSRITTKILETVMPDLLKGSPIPLANKIYFTENEFRVDEIVKKINEVHADSFKLGDRTVTIEVLDGLVPKRVVLVRGNISSDLRAVAGALRGYKVINIEDFFGRSGPYAREWAVREFLGALRDRINVCVADCATDLSEVKEYAMNCIDIGMTVVTIENASPNVMSGALLRRIKDNPVKSFEHIAHAGVGKNTILALPATPFLGYARSTSVSSFYTVVSRGWDSRPFKTSSMEFQASEIAEHRGGRGVLRVMIGKVDGRKALVIIERLGTFVEEDAGRFLLEDFATFRVRCDIRVVGILTAG